ncbi:MAG: hypothetical protein JRH20_11845 [Deltaproteobacteria bacterium]|nr:hypothetical protein [Deltaproteobacteria bacterium]
MDLYIRGQYGAAVRELRPLVEWRTLADRADHLEALKTYGIALCLHGAHSAADRAFRALLRFDPAVGLDPRFVRPEAVAFFEGVRGRYRREMDNLVATSAPQGSALVNLLPPWGQFRNGQNTKAKMLLGVEVVSALVSTATAVMLYSWRDEQGTFGEHAGSADTLQRVNVISFALLAGALVYGVVDGLYYYYRERKARLTPLLGHPMLRRAF